MYDVGEIGNNELIQWVKENKLYLKQNTYLLDIIDKIEQIKYPVVAVIMENFVDIRLNRVLGKFRNFDPNFYRDQINKMVRTLQEVYNLELQPLDFSNSISKIEEEIQMNKRDLEVSIQSEDELELEFDDFIVKSKQMHLSSGAKAKLDSDANPRYVMPILGDLEEFIEVKDDLFNQNTETLKIKDELLEFIDKINRTSDVPSIGIVLDANNNKYEVSITHNYRDQWYSLFQYKFPFKSNEKRMDYVREYFKENCREFES